MNGLRNHFKSLALCMACLLCCGLPLASQGARPSVAIMEPVGNSAVTAINKMTAMGTLEQYIINTGRYRVIDRSRIDQILQEHSFARDGLVDRSKVKEIGKMLQADLVAVSETRKDDGEFIVRLSMIDVESGEVVASAFELIARDSSDEIRNAIDKAARLMLGSATASNNSGAAEDLQEYFAKMAGIGGEISRATLSIKNLRDPQYDTFTMRDYNWRTRMLPSIRDLSDLAGRIVLPTEAELDEIHKIYISYLQWMYQYYARHSITSYGYQAGVPGNHDSQGDAIYAFNQAQAHFDNYRVKLTEYCRRNNSRPVFYTLPR